MEVAYFVCLNNDCVKHRNIFVEGDPQHADCKRSRLYLQGESADRSWLGFALPAVLAMAAAAATTYFLRQQSRRQNHLPPLGERKTETWSGTQRTTEERKGSAVPPPIS